MENPQMKKPKVDTPIKNSWMKVVKPPFPTD